MDKLMRAYLPLGARIGGELAIDYPIALPAWLDLRASNCE